MARPPTHHAERHSVVFLKFLGTTTQNLTARTTTILCFWGVFRRNVSLAKFAWRNLPGKFAWRNLPAKFAGEICRRKLPAKFAAEFVGEIFGEKTLVKPNLIFGEKPPHKTFSLCKFHRSQNAPPTHPKNPAFSEVGPKETS